MSLKEKKIVFTIAREYGSGGRYIGKKIADYLEIPFIDKEIVEIAAAESGVRKELFENIDEKPRGFLSGEFISSPFSAISPMPINDTLFNLQAETILRLAEKGSCVIVGRCADYILRDFDNTVNVFIHSDEEDKIQRLINYYNEPENQAEEIMKKMDKKRQAYHNYYADSKWGIAANYDITLNTACVGIDGAVKLLIDFAETKFNVDTNKPKGE